MIKIKLLVELVLLSLFYKIKNILSIVIQLSKQIRVTPKTVSSSLYYAISVGGEEAFRGIILFPRNHGKGTSNHNGGNWEILMYAMVFSVLCNEKVVAKLEAHTTKGIPGDSCLLIQFGESLHTLLS